MNYGVTLSIGRKVSIFTELLSDVITDIAPVALWSYSKWRTAMGLFDQVVQGASGTEIRILY